MRRHAFRSCVLVALGAFAAGAAAQTQAPSSPTAPAKPQAKPPAKPTPAPPPVLEGIVRGPDKKPIEKALVAAVPATASGPFATGYPLVIATRTDAQGRFRIELKKREPHTVRVESAGLAAHTRRDVAPGTPLTIDLARGGSIEGVVKDAETGQPAANAMVVARDASAPSVPGEADAGRVAARSDAAGRFVLAGLAGGQYTVSARRPGTAASRPNVRVGARVELLLLPAASIVGTVQGPDGRPLAGVAMQAFGRWRARASVEPTDAQGGYELAGLDAGVYDVVALAAGLAPAVSSNVLLERGGETRVDLKLGPGTRVVGRLLDARDRPVRGQVAVGEMDGDPTPLALAERLSADAGDDGRFAIEAVPAGEHAVLVNAPGQALQRVDFGARATDRQVDLGDVRLEVGLAIRGRVRTAAGQPVPEASITAMAMMRRSPVPIPQTTSEADGSFVLAGLEQAPHRVVASAHGFAPTDKTAEPGGDPLDLVMEPAGTISGVVVDERSRPVEDFRVGARPVDDRAMRMPPRVDDFTAADGRFTLTGVAPGAYAVTVSATERETATVSGIKVASGADTDAGTVKLGAGGVVRGSVVDEGGASIAGASVRATGQGRDFFAMGNSPQATSDLSGAFELRGVPAGAVRLGATHPGYAASEQTYIEVDPAKPTSDVRLVMSQGGRVAGSVKRRDGMGLAGQTVRVTHNEPGRPMGSEFSAVTRGDGSFALEHVTPGRLLLSVFPPSAAGFQATGITREIEVREGETTTVDLVNREILLSGRVTRSGAPAAGLRLEARAGGRFFASGMTAMPAASTTGPQRMTAVTRDDGGFEMLLDEPGSVVIVASSADGRLRLPQRIIEVPDADAHSVEISYSGVSVTGLVVDKDTEAPLPYAGVYAAPRDPRASGNVGGTAGPDGRFQLEVEPGDYRVGASSREEGYGSAEVEVAVGASGVSDVRVAVPKGLAIAGRLTDMSGRPVVGASVFAQTPEGSGGGYGWGDSLGDGTFKIGGLKEGTYVVTAFLEAGMFGLAPAVVAGAKSANVVLRPGGRLDVTIVGASGEPIAGAWPSVSRVDGVDVRMFGRALRPTNDQGFTEMLVPSGDLVVGARKGPLNGSAEAHVDPGERGVLRITLKAGPTQAP